ncbi:PaaI family thioesterase [Nocardia seriolae]|nr:hotdog fold thioesterase [Nocardia seriolae]MTJ71686.1 hotdog fold thioesterase [Nocardia seriolae]MTJ86493.1 hotdog fold thioesterase [Nocardia seriolae]MTK30487.1 hotdog fold thioesterase [Nocardia seriolae]MTK39433.1 hotdog fold thioesterase [Nocardia seriolae]
MRSWADGTESVPCGPLAVTTVGAVNSENPETGLDFLRSIIDGRRPQPPISATLGFELVAAETGSAVFEGETSERLYNPMGSVHGGYLATLLDSALGSAVCTRLPAGSGYTTAQLNVNLLRPVYAHTGKLRATGRAVHVGRTLATAEAQLIGIEDGKLYAHATTTCAIFAAR